MIIKLMGVALICSCSFFSYSLEKINQQLLNYANACPESYRSNVRSLVLYLKKPAKTQAQTVEVFCYWIAGHISYDVGVFQGGKFIPTSNTLQVGKGICQNYAELLQQMCEVAGIECYVVKGYSKGIDYQTPFSVPDHAWNVVKVNNQYLPSDPTWASGYCTGSGKSMAFRQQLNVSYILSDPDHFILKHLPADPRWQLRTSMVTMKSFELYDSLKDIVSKSTFYGQYKDSISAYANSDLVQRRLITAKSAYHFNPTNTNLKEMANAISTKAWQDSRSNNKSQLETSNQSYVQAIGFYEILDDDYSRRAIVSCRKIMAHNTYKLNQLVNRHP